MDVLHTLMSRITDGFEFIISMINQEKIQLSRPISMSSFENIQLLPLMKVCLQRILVKFNIQDYAYAQCLTESLIIFVTEREDSIIFRLPVCPCKHILVSPNLPYGIVNPVLRIIPFYKYANDVLN